MGTLCPALAARLVALRPDDGILLFPVMGTEKWTHRAGKAA